VLQEYKEPVLYLDSDMLVMGPLDELFGELEAYDLLVQYRPQADVSGAGGTRFAGKFNSGVIAIRPSDVGIEFARQYDRRITEWIDTGKQLCKYDEDSGIETCIDQEFLYLVYEEFKDRLKFAPLPDKFNDSRFRPGSVIWHGKGVARKRLPYVLGKMSYDNVLAYCIFSLIRFPFFSTYYHLQQWALVKKRSKNAP
jgi:alpha-N-acetylglucosamine transferase